jgi:transposase-like protein
MKLDEMTNFKKLGGPGQVINVDETMMNYKCKSHRGRSPLNRTDALCIVELDGHITRAYACVIESKSMATLIPIIMDRVEAGSVIHSDELKSYLILEKLGYEHKKVCHKYRFVDILTGAQTQAVESFNNCLKYEIKLRKGIRTEDRSDFLVEFVWKFNNRFNRLEKLLELIKI